MESTKEIQASQLIRRVSEVTNKVEYLRQTFTITKHGKPIAQIVPLPKPDNSNGKKTA